MGAGYSFRSSVRAARALTAKPSPPASLSKLVLELGTVVHALILDPGGRSRRVSGFESSLVSFSQTWLWPLSLLKLVCCSVQCWMSAWRSRQC